LRAIVISAALFSAVFFIHFMHLKLSLAIPLVAVCFGAYVLAFWVFAVDEEDRVTIFGLRERAFALLRARRAPAVTALPLSSNDAAD
jgi:hypothetical protein